MKLNVAWLHVLCEGVGGLGQFTVRNKCGYSFLFTVVPCILILSMFFYLPTDAQVF